MKSLRSKKSFWEIRLRYLLVLSIVLLFFYACKKQDPAYSFAQDDLAKEGLSFEEDSVIASIPYVSLGSSEIVLANGETMQQFYARLGGNVLPKTSAKLMSSGVSVVYGPAEDREIFNYKLLNKALEICDPTFFRDKETDVMVGTEIFGRPKQNGLAYVYNADVSLTVRKRAGKCPLLLYGIDCSGMSTLMFNNAGVVFNTKYASFDLASEGVLNAAIRNSPSLKDFDYQYEVQPRSFLSQVSSGDVIYFRHDNGRIFHLGIILRGKNGLLNIFQSNGSDIPAKPPKPGKEPDRGCEIYSMDQRRGPHQVPVQDMITWKGYKDFGFLHLVPRKKVPEKLIGLWKFVKENSSVGAGNKRIPIKSVNVDNPFVRFDGKNNFTAYGNDTGGEYKGTFVTYYGDTHIRLSGIKLYNEDPSDAQILELSDKTLRLYFYIEEYKQHSELIFEKQ